MLSQEAAKKGKDAMLNEHERHQIELNSMRQSSRKQHQKLKELLPALLAPWPQHCCRRRDLERACRNKAASLHPDKRGCHEAFCGCWKFPVCKLEVGLLIFFGLFFCCELVVLFVREVSAGCIETNSEGHILTVFVSQVLGYHGKKVGFGLEAGDLKCQLYWVSVATT